MRRADAYPLPTFNAPVRFAFAIATVALAVLIARSFGGLLDGGGRFFLLSMAVMASAWFAGTGPALSATVSGALIGATAARPPPETEFTIYAQLAVFVAHSLLVTAVISELRRARRAAEQRAHEAHQARRESETASRLKDEFLATISHELRTPLNAVLGWVHLLRTGKLDEGTAERGLESIDRNARLQAQLTGNLLDISKALTGRLHVESRPLCLVEIVRQGVMAAQPAAHAKGVEVAQDLPDAPVAVLGDWTRLRQVIWHLIANALKFTPRGGTIGVKVRSEGEAATLVVCDSGPGINPAFLPRIFDRFSQEDASPTRAAGGLGVGLSLVRELIELHGGDISAANRPHGSGAEFTVRLPLQPAGALEPPQDSRTPTETVAGPAPLEGVRVLVLDRDSDGRELVQRVLQQRGAVVFATGSVGAALETLESWRPDVLVSDTGSPERDSYALVGKVRSLDVDRGGRIPALALTTFARTDERVRVLLASVLRDLPKPVEPSVLTSEIAWLTEPERRRARGEDT